MFDFDAGKIIIVGVVALIFIPPKDLPRVLRQVGQFVSKMRRMAAEFQGQFMDAMKEADMADLKREAQKLSDAARLSTGLGTIRDLDRQMTGTLDQASHSPAASPSDVASTPSPETASLEASTGASPIRTVTEDAAHGEPSHAFPVADPREAAAHEDAKAAVGDPV